MVLSLLLASTVALAAPPKTFPGIRKTSERRYVVEAQAVKAMEANLSAALQTARMVPHLEKGRFAGFVFQAIDDDSLFRALGFRPGDVLKRVNDVVFDNPAKGLVAFQVLKEAKRWTVHVVRKRKPLKIDYVLEE